jgi:hypothetical protein
MKIGNENAKLMFIARSKFTRKLCFASYPELETGATFYSVIKCSAGLSNNIIM